jgi:hypothetical protein
MRQKSKANTLKSIYSMYNQERGTKNIVEIAARATMHSTASALRKALQLCSIGLIL